MMSNPTIDEEQYLKGRVDDQIDYYDIQSKKGRNWYKVLTTFQIISGVLIPFISGFSGEILYSEWIIAVMGLIITISTAFLSLNKYQERWINFRTTCENLKHFKYLYTTRSIPYDKEDAFSKFVNDVESVISKENSDWDSYIRKQSESAE